MRVLQPCCAPPTAAVIASFAAGVQTVQQPAVMGRRCHLVAGAASRLCCFWLVLIASMRDSTLVLGCRCGAAAAAVAHCSCLQVLQWAQNAALCVCLQELLHSTGLGGKAADVYWFDAGNNTFWAPKVRTVAVGVTLAACSADAGCRPQLCWLPLHLVAPRCSSCSDWHGLGSFGQACYTVSAFPGQLCLFLSLNRLPCPLLRLPQPPCRRP